LFNACHGETPGAAYNAGGGDDEGPAPRVGSATGPGRGGTARAGRLAGERVIAELDPTTAGTASDNAALVTANVPKRRNELIAPPPRRRQRTRHDAGAGE
jgi:hypothetical protein